MSQGIARLEPRDRRALAFIGGWIVLLHTLGGIGSYLSEERLATFPGAYLDSGTGFLLLSLFWVGVIPAFDRRLLAAAAVVVAVPVIVQLSMGATGPTAAQVGVGHLVTAVVLAVTYAGLRRLLPAPMAGQLHDWYGLWQRQWVPQRAADLVAALLASLVSGVAGVLVGAVPSLRWGVVDRATAVAWIFDLGLTTFITVTCLALVFRPPSVELRGRNLVALVTITALSIVLVYVVLTQQSQPLTWMVVLPSLLAGFMLRPWAAAWHAIILATSALTIANTAGYLRSWHGSLPAGPIFVALVSASVFIALAISLLQRERGRLVRRLSQERTEADLQANLLRTVLAGMGDGVVITDRHGQIFYQNEATAELLQLHTRAWDPGTWPETLTAFTEQGRVIRDGHSLQTLWRDAGRSQDPVTRLELAGVEGELAQSIEISTHAIQDQGEHRLVFFFHDNTAQAEREAAMRAFTAAAAHDLKGPLAGMTGWLDIAAEIADDTESPAMLADALERARGGGQRLRTIIDDWLQFSLVRDGQLAAERVLVADAVQAAVGEVDSSATIVVDTRHEVLADPALVRQLLGNLIGNGLKYRHPDVDPRLTVRSHDHSPGWVRVEVSDNGIGISAGDEKRLFDMFHRSSQVVGRFEGSGIGLAVCREIVQRHGGRIWARRNPDQGSTFAFTLPGLLKTPQ